MDYTELVKSLRYVADNKPVTSPELLTDSADAIELLQKTQQLRWIPVMERLPEPGVPCICWCKGGTYGQIRWYGLYYLTSHRTWAFYDNDYIDNREVTHWMYRPEPPKEETE